MEARCVHCGEPQTVDDEVFGNREKVDFDCVACGKSFPVVNPRLSTFRMETTRRKIPAIKQEISSDGRTLRLPDDKEISLKVVEGEESGTVYPVTKPRVTIGRANADVVVNDQMSSRLHCMLEISDEWILIRDMGSTNGTVVDGQNIQTATLSNGSTFRIGKHSFQIVIGPKSR